MISTGSSVCHVVCCTGISLLLLEKDMPGINIRKVCTPVLRFLLACRLAVQLALASTSTTRCDLLVGALGDVSSPVGCVVVCQPRVLPHSVHPITVNSAHPVLSPVCCDHI